jgi:hypothetical protein
MTQWRCEGFKGRVGAKVWETWQPSNTVYFVRMEMTSDMMGDAIDDAMEVRGFIGLMSQLSEMRCTCSAACLRT